MFSRARLKLTAIYTGTVLLIVFFFSVGFFLIANLDFFGGMEIAPEGDHFNLSQEFEAAIDRKVITALLMIDPIIIILTLGIGWFLAGRTLRPIQHNLQQQKRFVSDAAHELRTPLSIMKAGLETIEAGSSPGIDDYQNLNLELLDEINRIVNLTSDLLFLSSGALSAATTVMKNIDISAICAKNANLMTSYSAQNGVLLNEEIEPGLHCQGDEHQIGRLLLNLFKNAIDYNREGGEVFLRLTRAGKKIILEISDSGIGISQEDLQHIFERFYKVDDSRERLNSGTGLGLSIVKAIVRAQHGKIGVESKVGEGTKVTVSLNALDYRPSTQPAAPA